MLVIFIFFSSLAPMLDLEKEYQYNHTKQATINLPESLAVNKNYQAANGKCELGQYRTVTVFNLECGGLLAAEINQESEILQKQSVEIAFPLSIIPTYIFDCVFRI